MANKKIISCKRFGEAYMKALERKCKGGGTRDKRRNRKGNRNT